MKTKKYNVGLPEKTAKRLAREVKRRKQSRPVIIEAALDALGNRPLVPTGIISKPGDDTGEQPAE